MIDPTIFLRPFSALYALILKLRHRMYDQGVLRSDMGALPTIVVGNLELGGTGKTPLTDYLLSMLEKEFKVGLLSRGYGRETTGFLEISKDSSAAEVGDEPLMLALRHPGVRAAVCEDRLRGLEMMNKASDLDIVILDDAFQHRALRSGFNILVTPYVRPFWKNHVVPEGSLRDIRQRARHAHAIVLSKCPEVISEEERKLIEEQLDWYSASPLFASQITYGPLRRLCDDMVHSPVSKEIILFTGIADDTRLREYLAQDFEIIHVIKYRDHHRYNRADIRKLKEISATFVGRQIALVTTAKDAVKLRSVELREEWEELPIFYQPIDLQFLDNGLDEMIKGYARANKRNN